MRSSSGERVVRRRLADGSIKEYRYPRAGARAPKIVAGSIDAMIDAWQASPEWADLAEATRTNYAIYLRALTPLGRQQVADIRRRHIIQLRNAIARARGNGAATGFMRATSALWAWGMDNDLAELNPCYRVKPLKRGTLPAWTEEVLAEALERLPQAYRRVVLLAVHTGQRRGDLCGLRWSAYNGRTITLRQQKDRRVDADPLVIPVHRDLRAELDAWKAEARTLTILTNPSGKPWTPPHLSRELGAKMLELGLGRFTLHGLRKLCAIRLAEAGATTHQIAAICGWRSLSMVQHYTRRAGQRTMAEAAIGLLEKEKYRMGSKAPKLPTRLVEKAGIALVVFHLACRGVETVPTSEGSNEGDLWAKLPDGLSSIEVKSCGRGAGWNLRQGQVEAAEWFVFVQIHGASCWILSRREVQALMRAPGRQNEDVRCITPAMLPRESVAAWDRLKPALRLRRLAGTAANYPGVKIVRRKLASGEIREYRYERTSGRAKTILPQMAQRQPTDSA